MRAPNEASTLSRKPKKSMFDKVIEALKKRQGGAPQMQLPSMNMEDDDTPPLPPVFLY